MEDAATAEISRAQIWQWLKHGAKTVDGELITIEYFNKLLKEELKQIKLTLGEENYSNGKFNKASELFNKISTSVLAKSELPCMDVSVYV